MKDPLPPSGAVSRLFVLLCGFEILPKTVSTRGRGARFILSEPVCAYLLDTTHGWVLLDTGLDPANARDPQRVHDRFTRHRMSPPVVRDAHLLETQLAQLGLKFGDIRHVILSHLHYDHAGGLRNFRHARISVQAREHRHAFAPDPGIAYFRDEYDLPGLDWDLRDGDWEAMPGLKLLETRGHTEGHQAAVVDLPRSGRLVLPFDVGDLQENFDDEVLPGEACDDAAALASLRRLRDLAAAPHAQLLLFHDPVAIQRLRLCPEAWD
jgi:N-acyl homoserine lactone hydrolase